MCEGNALPSPFLGMAYDASAHIFYQSWVSWVCRQRLLASVQWEASAQAVQAAPVAAAPAAARAAQAARAARAARAAPVLGALVRRFK